MVGDEDGTRAVEGDGAGTCGVADAGTVRWGETCGERGWGVGGEGGQESETGRADYFRASGKQRSTDEGQKKKKHPRVGKTRRKQPPFNPSPFSPPPPPPFTPSLPPTRKRKKGKPRAPPTEMPARPTHAIERPLAREPVRARQPLDAVAGRVVVVGRRAHVQDGLVVHGAQKAAAVGDADGGWVGGGGAGDGCGAGWRGRRRWGGGWRGRGGGRGGRGRRGRRGRGRRRRGRGVACVTPAEARNGEDGRKGWGGKDVEMCCGKGFGVNASQCVICHRFGIVGH